MGKAARRRLRQDSLPVDADLSCEKAVTTWGKGPVARNRRTRSVAHGRARRFQQRSRAPSPNRSGRALPHSVAPVRRPLLRGGSAEVQSRRDSHGLSADWRSVRRTMATISGAASPSSAGCPPRSLASIGAGALIQSRGSGMGARIVASSSSISTSEIARRPHPRQHLCPAAFLSKIFATCIFKRSVPCWPTPGSSQPRQAGRLNFRRCRQKRPVQSGRTLLALCAARSA